MFAKAVIQGISALCYMHRRGVDAVVCASDVSRALAIPSEQGAKILHSLASAGMLRSLRGCRGGYALGRALEEISLADVLTALGPIDDEAHLRPAACVGEPSEACSLHSGLVAMYGRALGALAGEMLAPPPRGSMVCGHGGHGGQIKRSQT